ncbi:phage tail terminator protein [Comamonas aquatica]|uniref:phage tail terminator protein n=1 Tax=Comamonas aquatica TaxID=225991 RepID=UPI00244CFB70|nr:hypothetical protein [Comamonas aquatica]MDH0494249.1 hypothetical protein [Comamonas aquatica]
MSYAPFDSALLEARIKAQCPDLREVGGAAEYAAVQDLRGFATPSAFVIFADEAAGVAPEGSPVAPAIARIGVVIAAQNFRAGAGGQMTQELRQLIGQVRKALIGWTPPALGATAVSWAGGAVMDYDKSTVLYGDTFSVTHFLTP